VFQIYMGPGLKFTAAPELDLLPSTPSAFQQTECDAEG